MVSAWVSDSSLYCQVSAGTGTGLSVLVYSGGQLGGMTNMFDYLQPQWDRVTPDHGPSTGAFSISIFGLFFGQVATQTQILRLGPYLKQHPSLIHPQTFVLGTHLAKRASGSQTRQFVVRCTKVTCLLRTLAWRTLPAFASFKQSVQADCGSCALRCRCWPHSRLLPAHTVQYYTAAAWA